MRSFFKNMKNEHKNDLIWSPNEDSAVQKSCSRQIVESAQADGPIAPAVLTILVPNFVES